MPVIKAYSRERGAGGRARRRVGGEGGGWVGGEGGRGEVVGWKGSKKNVASLSETDATEHDSGAKKGRVTRRNLAAI
jgi:hypothetical protein